MKPEIMAEGPRCKRRKQANPRRKNGKTAHAHTKSRNTSRKPEPRFPAERTVTRERRTCGCSLRGHTKIIFTTKHFSQSSEIRCLFCLFVSTHKQRPKPADSRTDRSISLMDNLVKVSSAPFETALLTDQFGLHERRNENMKLFLSCK